VVSNKVFAIIYGLIALLSAAQLAVLYSSGQMFTDTQGTVLSAATVLVLIICSIAAPVKWSDKSTYRYDVPAQTPKTRVVKAMAGSAGLATVGAMLIAGLLPYLLGFEIADKILLGYMQFGVWPVIGLVFFILYRYMKQ
jgi:hypothetical protein